MSQAACDVSLAAWQRETQLACLPSPAACRSPDSRHRRRPTSPLRAAAQVLGCGHARWQRLSAPNGSNRSQRQRRYGLSSRNTTGLPGVNYIGGRFASITYLVQLLTFHQTAAGQHYYKIGKAKSIPKRIKQFGPCRLIKTITLRTEQDSLRVEAELHSKFSCLRRPDTEIFCMNVDVLSSVLAECILYETLEHS